MIHPTVFQTISFGGHLLNFLAKYCFAARNLLGVGRTTELLNQGTDCCSRRMVPFLFSVVHDALACFKVHFFHAELSYTQSSSLQSQ